MQCGCQRIDRRCPMNIVEALSGSAGLAGVQWILQGTPARKALRRVLAQMSSEPDRLGPCRLQRAKFDPGRKLKAYYTVRLTPPVAGERGFHPIAVTWSQQPGEELPEAKAALDEIQAGALRRGLSAPFGTLVADAPGWGMRVQVSPLDARFPQLVRLTDPQHVRNLLAVDYPCAVTSLRYRPGERHVLRYEPLAATGRADARWTIFAKLYAGPEESAHSFDVALRVAGWLAAFETSVTAARPLAHVVEEAVVLYPEVVGAPLSRYLRHPELKAMQHLRHAGATLRRLHAAPEALTDGLKLHTFAEEVAVTVRASRHICALLPPASLTIADLLDRALALHRQLPLEPPTFTHGDFKADHLWIAPAGLTLIDFDSCALADPALDLGKFLADIQWWYHVYGLPNPEQAQAHFMEGYGPDVPPARLARARLYEVLLLTRITARRVRLFDPDWAACTTRLLNRAEKGLEI